MVLPMRSIETIRAEFGAPDFKLITVWKLTTGGRSTQEPLAVEGARLALATAALWGARYRGQVMAVQGAEARALIAAGAREAEHEPGLITIGASLE